MIAKDLLTALNDIDPKLLEDVEPWGAAPKTIRRHPVWAVAAALALCLGIGTAVVLLTGQLSLVSPEGSMMVAEDSAQTVEVPDLEFAVNKTGTSSGTGVLYAEGVTQRDLTLDELEYLRSQPGLSWMKEYYLLGSGIFGEDGNIIQVTVSGYTPSTVEESPQPFPVGAAPAFLLALGENELPTDIKDQLFFLEEPNNTVEGVEVKAAQSEYQESYIDPVSGETTYVDSTLYCTGYTLDGASVGLIAVGDGNTLTTEDAEHLAEVAAGYGVHYGLSLEGLSAEPKGKDTPNVNYGDSYHLTVLGPLGSRAPLDFATYTVETQEEYGSYEEFLQAMEEDFNLGRWPEGFAEGSTNRELTQEEMQSIWGGQLPWQENLPLAGWAVFDPSGDLEGVYLYGADEGSQEIGSRFLVVLRPGPLDWEALRRRELSYDIIQEPNNQVNGQDVYAVTNTLETFREEDTTGRMIPLEHLTAYRASFQKGESPVAVTVYGYAQRPAGDELTPEEQTADALAQDEAKALVEAVTGRSLYGPLTLDALGGPDVSSTSVQAESSASSQADASPTLTFAENAGPELSTGWDVPEGSATREMTQAELDALWGQELRDLQEVPILTGQVATNGTGEVIRATVRGYASAEAQSQGLECFSVHLVPDGPAVSDALDRVSFLEEPNNQVQGVGVYAAALESTRGQELPVTWYSAAFLTAGEAPVGVAVSVAQGEWGCSTKYGAEDLVARAVGQYIQEGVFLDTLAAGDSGGLTFTTNTLEPYCDEFFEFHRQNLEANPIPDDFVSRPMDEEELAQIWGGQLPWADEYLLQGTALFTSQGELLQVWIHGNLPDQKDSDSAFAITLTAGDLPWSWPQYATTFFLDQPNNQIDGVGVYATQYLEEYSWEESDGSGERVKYDLGDYNNQYVYIQQPEYTVSVQATPAPWGFSTTGDAQAFAEAVAEASIEQGIDLAHIHAEDAR